MDIGTKSVIGPIPQIKGIQYQQISAVHQIIEILNEAIFLLTVSASNF